MGEDERRVKGFAEDLSMAFPVFVDEATSVGAQYRVRGAPTTYFIDASGVIRQRHVGALSSRGLVEILSGRSAFPNS
jgi:peroxiredoxin